MPWIPNRIGESTPGAGDGEIIQNEHMNVLRDAAVIQFSTVAERDTYWPGGTAPNGARCVTLDTGTTWQIIGGAWRALFADLVGNPWAEAAGVSHPSPALVDVLTVNPPAMPFATTMHVDGQVWFGQSGALVNGTPDILRFVDSGTTTGVLVQAGPGAAVVVPVKWSWAVAANADPSFKLRCYVTAAASAWVAGASCHYHRYTF